MRNLNTKSEHVSVSGLRPMDSGSFADNPLEFHSRKDSADKTTEATSIDFTDFLRPAQQIERELRKRANPSGE